MRMIKYRAWDNVKNKMYYVGEESDISFSFDSNGIIATDITEGDENFKELHHLIYTQYTGLKDKNGVEIYEGDVLSDVISRGKKVLLNVIVFEKGAFRHKFLDENTRHLRGREIEPMFDNTSLIFEVAGNIYEHPHLLPKEEQE